MICNENIFHYLKFPLLTLPIHEVSSFVIFEYCEKCTINPPKYFKNPPLQHSQNHESPRLGSSRYHSYNSKILNLLLVKTRTT